MPTTPQKAAGWRIEPPVSEPSANKTSPAATAAADPPDEPPGTVSRFHGFFVFWNAEFSLEEPIANSSIFNFPIVIVSAFEQPLHHKSGQSFLRFCLHTLSASLL